MKRFFHPLTLTAWMATSLVATLALLAPAPARAQVPSTMSYQGVLTDGAGNLVPDGAYNLTFKLYDVPVLGAALWTETQVGVTVTKGGFSVIIGSINPITLGFDKPYYLGITVAANPEMTPRVALASSPYGLSLRLPFDGSANSANAALGIHNNGTGVAIIGDPSVQVGTAARDGLFRIYDAGQPGIESGSWGTQGSYLHYLNSLGNYLGGFEPDSGGLDAGYFWISGGNNSGGFVVDGNAGSANGAFVGINGPNSSTFFDTNQTGDGAVTLPANSVSSSEILDEPGVTQAHNSSVPFTNTAFTDVATTTITIPAPGYIVLEGDGQVNLSGTAASNEAYVQITASTPGVLDATHYGFVGSDAYAGVGSNFYLVHQQHLYYESLAGSYTFYFQLEKSSASGSAYIWQPTLRATYYPKSYGPVTTIASGPDLSRFPTARPVTVDASLPQPTGPGSEVDLRDLELRAIQARADADRAQRALIEAQIAKQRQSAAAPKPAKPAK